MLLRLDEGASSRQVQGTCHVSSDLIAAVTRQFRSGGVAEVLAPRTVATAAPGWVFQVLVWLKDFTPRACRFFRSRWTCHVLAVSPADLPQAPCDLRQRRVPPEPGGVEAVGAAGQRIELHFLPTDALETNPIERVWWHLHETIPRNHQCTTIEELLREVYD